MINTKSLSLPDKSRYLGFGGKVVFALGFPEFPIPFKTEEAHRRS